jgi:hypothetical protein
MTNTSHINKPDWWLRSDQVGCPACGAPAGEPCTRKDGLPSKTMHPDRKAYADDLNNRAIGKDTTSRWYRHEYRNGRIPSPPAPHGTEGAYFRHKRAGEDPCDECMTHMRALWTVRNNARKADKLAAAAEAEAKKAAAAAKRAATRKAKANA